MGHETSVQLNVQEIGVILSALQLLETGDEYRINKEYGSATAICNRMEDLLDKMNTEDLQLESESYIEASF